MNAAAILDPLDYPVGSILRRNGQGRSPVKQFWDEGVDLRGRGAADPKAARGNWGENARLHDDAAVDDEVDILIKMTRRPFRKLPRALLVEANVEQNSLAVPRIAHALCLDNLQRKQIASDTNGGREHPNNRNRCEQRRFHAGSDQIRRSAPRVRLAPSASAKVALSDTSPSLSRFRQTRFEARRLSGRVSSLRSQRTRVLRDYHISRAWHCFIIAIESWIAAYRDRRHSGRDDRHRSCRHFAVCRRHPDNRSDSSLRRRGAVAGRRVGAISENGLTKRGHPPFSLRTQV
jgi:hypothetical protein